MKTMLWGSVALAGFAVGANAADMPPIPLPPPLPVVADCWTGFYVGGNLGYHMSQDIISSIADPLGWGVDGASIIDTRSPTWLGSRGAIVGGQIGFNWQLGNVVFGWEVDGQWLGGSANRQYTFSGAVMPVTGDFMYNSSAPNVAATLRPRLGATFGNLLVYGTGGLAMGWYSNTDSFASFGGTTLATTPSTTVRPGWTGGGPRMEIPAAVVGQGGVSLSAHAELQRQDRLLRRLRDRQRHPHPPQRHRQFRPHGRELARDAVVRAIVGVANPSAEN